MFCNSALTLLVFTSFLSCVLYLHSYFRLITIKFQGYVATVKEMRSINPVGPQTVPLTAISVAAKITVIVIVAVIKQQFTVAAVCGESLMNAEAISISKLTHCLFHSCPMMGRFTVRCFKGDSRRGASVIDLGGWAAGVNRQSGFTKLCVRLEFKNMDERVHIISTDIP